jgi:hypothetical protein
MAPYCEFRRNVVVRRASTFKQRDVTRAAKAMQLAGVTARVDILRDGTIRLTPMPPEASAPDAKAMDTQPGAPGLRAWD